jgi:hypothetical protein
MDRARNTPMEEQPLEDPHNAARPECLAAAAMLEMTRYARTREQRAAAAAQLLLRALASHPALERGGLRELAEQMQDGWYELAHASPETRSHEMPPKADKSLQALLSIHRSYPY